MNLDYVRNEIEEKKAFAARLVDEITVAERVCVQRGIEVEQAQKALHEAEHEVSHLRSMLFVQQESLKSLYAEYYEKSERKW